jgi:hypothetical protein
MSCNIMTYEERVDEILAYLKRVQEDIDGYAIPQPNAMRALVKHANLRPEFLRSSLTVAENQKNADWSTLDAIQVKDSEDFDRAYGRLVTELGRMQHGVRYAIAQKKAKVGLAALRIFAIARALNRHGKDALVPEEQVLRDHLGARRPRKRTKKVDPQPE